jgi:hypothetical protein
MRSRALKTPRLLASRKCGTDREPFPEPRVAERWEPCKDPRENAVWREIFFASTVTRCGRRLYERALCCALSDHFGVTNRKEWTRG